MNSGDYEYVAGEQSPAERRRQRDEETCRRQAEILEREEAIRAADAKGRKS